MEEEVVLERNLLDNRSSVNSRFDGKRAKRREEIAGSKYADRLVKFSERHRTSSLRDGITVALFISKHTCNSSVLGLQLCKPRTTLTALDKHRDER